MRMTRVLTAVCVAMAVPALAAAQISTLAGAAAQEPLIEVARAFKQQTGHEVRVEFDTVPNITRRLAAGEATDVFVGTTAAVDQAIKDGRADAATRAPLGRIGVGVAISRGGTKPDVATVDALKAALARADTILVSRGTSGAYVQKMLGDLGVMASMKGKIVEVASGVAVMDRLGTSRNEIGFTMVSEIMYGQAHGGGTFVAPLPDTLQNYTQYEAVVMSRARTPDEARAFVRALATPAARKLFAATGWQGPNASTR
jgi:molybdate transport system substrate-binding protein